MKIVMNARAQNVRVQILLVINLRFGGRECDKTVRLGKHDLMISRRFYRELAIMGFFFFQVTESGWF